MKAVKASPVPQHEATRGSSAWNIESERYSKLTAVHKALVLLDEGRTKHLEEQANPRVGLW